VKVAPTFRSLPTLPLHWDGSWGIVGGVVSMLQAQ